jgi:glycosyltransferase involved in cell wall biosynthesis
VIREYGIQAVWAEDPFELGALAADAARTAGIPLYVDVETDFLSPWYATMTGMYRSSKVSVPKKNRMRVGLSGRTLAKAAGIRTMSERVKASLVKEYGDRIPVPVVIPVQVRFPMPQPAAFPVPPFPFTLIAAGRLDAGRRVVDILDALARVKDQYPGVGLFVIGDGPERKHLERHAKRLKLEDRAIFLGDRHDAWALMRSAHAFVQASAHEGYGRRLLQAALARVPIITTDVGIVGEAFVGYDDVLAFPPADPAALSVHIAGLIEDGQARVTLAMNAEAKAKAYLAAAGSIPERLAAFLQPKA